MIADSENDIKHLKAIGHICAKTLQKMMEHAKPGMTTAELDNIGKEFLEKEGAQSAPMAMYQFPGATCISISPVIAHGIFRASGFSCSQTQSTSAKRRSV